jgi:hypothetical protein
MCDTFVLVELSHDTFTLFIDDILNSILQKYLIIFLFCDRIFTGAYRILVSFSLLAKKDEMDLRDNMFQVRHKRKIKKFI